MKSLGRLLRNSIESSGYTIYRAASKAGINRTTLQKVLSDDRPASRELLSQLLPILKLSPSEEKDIRDLFEISQDGETLYNQRRYIKNMLESMSHLEFLPEDTDMTYERLKLYESSFLQFGQQPIQGVYNVEHLLGALLNKESLHKSSIIRINVPGNLSVIDQFLVHNLSYCSKLKDMTIQHITSFVKTPESSQNPLINLDILSKILPFSIYWDLNYKIYYYYSNELISYALNMAFPYYILFSDTVVLLTADGTTALPVNEPPVIQYFQNLFTESLKHTVSLITDCPTPHGILNYLFSTDKEQLTCNTIEAQPCLAAFLTESMTRKYTRPDAKDRIPLIQAVISRIQHLSLLENRICIFSQSGLSDFIQTGILTDFPSGYTFPIEKADRITILKSLYDACRLDKNTFRMANPAVFPFSSRLNCTLRNDWGLDFSSFDHSGEYFRYIHIAEQTISGAFEDFFLYLLESELLYTKEETLSQIRNGISYLKESS